MIESIHKDDMRSVAELIGVALTESDEDTAWEAVAALHWRGTREVLKAAQDLCRSSCERERQLGCDVLGQIGVPERTFPNECVATLLEMLHDETDESVLCSLFIAFSHLGDERGPNAAVEYVEHPDPAVRRAVVHVLWLVDTDATTKALVALSTDEDVDVRDCATFALAQQTQADSPAIRDALAARLTDDDADTRGEALVGLANRADARAVHAIAEDPASFTETDHLDAARSILKEQGLINSNRKR